MYNFKFYAPTKAVFGRNTEEQLADLVREFGGKKLLIHYGGGGDRFRRGDRAQGN